MSERRNSVCLDCKCMRECLKITDGYVCPECIMQRLVAAAAERDRWQQTAGNVTTTQAAIEHDLQQRLAEAEAWRADVVSSVARCMDERCDMSERHCTCVPMLRAEVKQLKQAVRILYTGTLQGHANHWDACGTHGANCPAFLFAARQREAAVEVLGRVPECEYVPEAEGGES